jgi:hypothetical protein
METTRAAWGHIMPVTSRTRCMWDDMSRRIVPYEDLREYRPSVMSCHTPPDGPVVTCAAGTER